MSLTLLTTLLMLGLVKLRRPGPALRTATGGVRLGGGNSGRGGVPWSSEDSSEIFPSIEEESSDVLTLFVGEPCIVFCLLDGELWLWDEDGSVLSSNTAAGLLRELKS